MSLREEHNSLSQPSLKQSSLAHGTCTLFHNQSYNALHFYFVAQVPSHLICVILALLPISTIQPAVNVSKQD